MFGTRLSGSNFKSHVLCVVEGIAAIFGRIQCFPDCLANDPYQIQWKHGVRNIIDFHLFWIDSRHRLTERRSNERRSERRSQLANDYLNGVQYRGNERSYERRSKNQRTHQRTAVLYYLPHMADKHIHCINFLYFFKLKKLYFPTAPNSNVIHRSY